MSLGHARFFPRTLAARFLLIVFLGALLPLALVGLWLTRSAERAGTALLRMQLETEADAMLAQVDRRWALREGELQLLANNSVAQSALGGKTLSRADSAYLLQLAQGLGSTISSIRYVDTSGREHWSFDVEPKRIGGPLETAPPRAIDVDRPVASNGTRIGRVLARLSMTTILSADLARPVAPGAVSTATDSSGLLWSSHSDSAMSVSNGVPPGWEIVTRSPRAAPFELSIAAPSAPFVKPFEAVARTGLTVLLVVALAAFAVSAVLTSQATRSLARLSEAASAVALGDLDRQVPASNSDEIGELATAFNRMTDSLRRTLAELSQQRALAAVGEFAASLAHEVRNSLTAVRVDLQHAKRHLPAENQGTMLLVRALESTSRLDSTVTSALRAARTGQVSPTPIDLRVVLEQAMRSATPTFDERCATLEPLVAGVDVEVVGDASALEHLFLNLLINAGQALGPGGTARVDIVRAGGHVLVRIEDTGAGIPVEQLASLGEPFQTTKLGGTGLGVPIARRIAVAHGGELRIDSAPNRGTTATVQLPLARQN
jgi:signal transduction histidine kinase